jgi:hypothetical protein
LNTAKRTLVAEFSETKDQVLLYLRYWPTGILGDEAQICEWFFASMTEFRSQCESKPLHHVAPMHIQDLAFYDLLAIGNDNSTTTRP